MGVAPNTGSPLPIDEEDEDDDKSTSTVVVTQRDVDAACASSLYSETANVHGVER